MPIVDFPVKQLKAYKPPLTRSKDFLGFWKENISMSGEQPLNSDVSKISYPVRKLEVSSVAFDGFLDKTPISAWLLKPNGKGPFPALLFLHGYGGNKGLVSDYLGWALQGYVVMAVDVRGQSGASPDYARYPSGGPMGNMTKGVLDKWSYYYRFVYMDCLRALELLLGRGDVIKEKVGVTGGSQGGGLTLAVTALDRRPSLSLPEVPYLCHFERATEVATGGPYLEIMEYIKMNPDSVKTVFETLSYFDGMNLAPGIRCPILVSVGLVDTICPPSTVFATYNHLTAKEKELSIYPGLGHESPNIHHEKKIAWAARHLLYP
jgi:cephalosporin-C deacetylase